MSDNEIPAVGTEQERKTFTQVKRHYDTAREDLEIRSADMDKKDILFRSHIEEHKWPYRSQVFDPRIFTTLYEKTARTFANKPRGRLIPREGGDVLKAKINNELLSFQWDDNERVNGESMLSKWMQMNLNARKYGAAFGLCNWHYEMKTKNRKGKGGKEEPYKHCFFDGPNFKPWPNRDVLHNPAYSTIKNWIQLRDYVTLQELQTVNDAARSKPIYKNLDILRQLLEQESQKGGDQRNNNYIIKNKSIKGLTDYLGTDAVFKVVEIVTEYREDKWITFAPKHGLILREIPNPYDHGQIPVVLLKYYPVDDDIYGLSEIEPVEKIQRAINAILCQYLDAINMSLYAPLKVSSVGGAVQMHTLEFGPGKKWLMTNPATDVMTHDQQISGVQEFTATYRFLVGALQEALGESSAVASSADPGEADKTATEIKDTALSRTARDNFNQLMLGEALKKQMSFWLTMNQQFLFSRPDENQKIIQIVGKDAIKYFQSLGLDGFGLNDDAQQMMADPKVAESGVQTTDLEAPLYPIKTDDGVVPKFEMDENGEVGSLIIEPKDLTGTYDFIIDVGSMSTTANQEERKGKEQFLAMMMQPQVQQQLLQEGKQVKLSDLIIDTAEDLGFKNADQYIETVQQGGMNVPGQLEPSGAAGTQAVPAGMANGGVGGIPAGSQAIPGGQTQPILS